MINKVTPNYARYWLSRILCCVGLVLPEDQRRIPVAGASVLRTGIPNPSGIILGDVLGVHKGIDIFAKEGTSVIAATSGLVVYSGTIDMGGNVVLILGAKWRFYYYAHLQSISAQAGQWRHSGEAIGTVGSTGNAAGKPPHLHFAISSLFPLFSQYDPGLPQAWKLLFYVNPDTYLKS